MTTFARFAEILEAITRLIAKLLSCLAALAVALIVAVLVWSSVQRYVLVRPIPAAEEIASYLFVVVAFLAAMEGMVAGRQIRVLPIWVKLPPRFQAWLMVVGHVLSIGVLAILIKQTADFALSSYQYGARSYVANLVEWPWMMVIPVALAALAFALFSRLMGDIVRAARGERLREAQPGEPGDLV